jgi:hypothetical protein
MSGLTAKWNGRESLMAAMRQIAPEAEVQIAGMQMKVANDLAKKIKTYAPVGLDKWRKKGRKAGTYRDAIEGARLADRPGQRGFGKSNKPDTRQATKDPNATGVFGEFIWHFLEFGTQKTARHPHIFPVYRAEKKNIKRRVNRSITVAVRKAMAGAGAR